MTDAALFAFLFLVPSALGIRATWRLWRVYLFDDDTRHQPILASFAAIATVITIAALWFGFVSLRRLLGFDNLEWAAAVSVVLAALILLIPAGLELLVDYVGKRKNPPERPGR